MQEAGRGRQRGQQLPGLRAGASSWPQPQIQSATSPSPPCPTQRLPGTEARPPGNLQGLPLSFRTHRERARGAALWPHLGTARPRLLPAPPRGGRSPNPASFLPPGLTRVWVPRAHSPHRPRPRHSQGHRRAAGSVGSGSAPCRPRRSRWCKRPPPSSPRRPPPGPGARTTGRKLRGQEAG